MTTTLYIPPKPEPCPDHGATRHVAGCEGCKRYARINALRRYRMDKLNIPNRLTDAAPVHQHLASLRAQGMTIPQISQQASISQNTINSILAGRRTYLHHDIADALSAVDPQPQARHGHVPAIGPRRRIQALYALGYGWHQIGQWLGTTDRSVWEMAVLDRPFMSNSIAARVCAVYAAHRDDTPPDGWIAGRTRTFARKHGWLTPAWWVDDIDDPDADPTAADPAVVSTATIDRILRGDYELPTPAERLEVTRRVLAAGGGASRLARLLHISGSLAADLIKQAKPDPSAADRRSA